MPNNVPKAYFIAMGDFIIHAPQGALHCNQKNVADIAGYIFLVAETGLEPATSGL